MKEKKYLNLLKNQLQPQPQRVVCGANYDAYGRAVVTIGIPREYKEGVITYVDKKTTSYEEYMDQKYIGSNGKGRKLILEKSGKNYK